MHIYYRIAVSRLFFILTFANKQLFPQHIKKNIFLSLQVGLKHPACLEINGFRMDKQIKSKTRSNLKSEL